MKRIICFLLILLLLAGCGKTVSEAPVTSISAEPTYITDKSGQIVFDTQLKELEPFTFEKCSHKYNYYRELFFTDESYGSVYPFIGGMIYDDYNTCTYTVGLCTGDGEIITDAVFRYVRTIHCGDHDFYVLYRFAEDERIDYLKNENGYVSFEDVRQCYIIRDDGAKAVNFSEEVYDAGTDGVEICAYGENGRHFFNQDLEGSSGTGYIDRNIYGTGRRTLICPTCNKNIEINSETVYLTVLYNEDTEENEYCIVHTLCEDGKGTVMNTDGEVLCRITLDNTSLDSVSSLIQKGNTLFANVVYESDTNENYGYEYAYHKIDLENGSEEIINGVNIQNYLFENKYYIRSADGKCYIYDFDTDKTTPVYAAAVGSNFVSVLYSGYTATYDRSGNLIFRMIVDGG